MESEENIIAHLSVPDLGNGAFQFPISPAFRINIELTELSEETFDNLYTLFDSRYKLALHVKNLKCEITGDFTHFEFKGRDESGIKCLIEVTNITSFVYDATL